MARSLAKIQEQIAALQRRAEALRAKEVDGVVKKIRVAIAHYGLTPDDLFGKAAARKTSGRSAAKPVGRKRGASAIKYRDEAGNSWTGVGRRPRWFKDAVAAGKSPQDLLAK